MRKIFFRACVDEDKDTCLHCSKLDSLCDPIKHYKNDIYYGFAICGDTFKYYLKDGTYINKDCVINVDRFDKLVERMKNAG